MFDFLKKAVVIISIILVFLLTVGLISASEDIQDNSTLEGFDADALDEINVEDNLNGSALKQAEAMDLNDNLTYSGGEDTLGAADGPDKGTYKSTAVRFSALTSQYTTGNTVYKVRACDVIKYGGENYILPKYGSIVKLKVYTGNSYKVVSGNIGNDGAASIKITGLSLGTHKVKVYFSGKYYGSSSIKVVKSSAKVYAPSKVIKYKKNYFYKIRAVDSSNVPLKGVKLHFTVSTNKKSKTYDVKTNSKGIVKIQTRKLPRGTYEITISKNNKKYEVQKKSKIVVKKAVSKRPAKLHAYAPAKTLKYRSGSYFKIAVKDDYAYAVGGVKLKVKVFTGKKSKTYTVKTNSRGVAKLNTKALSLGTHKVIIASGDAKYMLNGVSKIVINENGDSNNIAPATLVSLQFNPKSNGDCYAKLKWESKKDAQYQILRKANGKYGVIATVTATSDVMSYSEKISEDKTFTYSVREIIRSSKNNKILGPHDTEGLKLLSRPKVTVDFQNLKAKVKWSKVSGATKYLIFRKVGRDGEFKCIASVGNDCFKYVDWYYKSSDDFAHIMYFDTFIDPGLNNLFYTVRACNDATFNGIAKKSYGLYLFDGDFHMEPPAIVSLENGTLKWSKTPNAQGYSILMDQYGDGNWKVIAKVSNRKGMIQSYCLEQVDKNAYYSVQAYSYKNGVKVYSNFDKGFSLMNRNESNSQYRILYIGDSITYGSPYTSNSTRHIFSMPYRIAQLLGCVYYNPSIPGSTYHDLGEENGVNIVTGLAYRHRITREVVDRLANGEPPVDWQTFDNDKNSEGMNNTSLEDYNIVVLAAGTNDYKDRTKLGKLNSNDVSKFNGALNYVLGKIEAASKNRVLRGETPIKVVFADLYYAQRMYDVLKIEDRDVTPNHKGLTLKDYQEALDLQYERWKSSKYLSLYNFKTRDYDIVNQDTCSYASVDNLHFTKYTYTQYGNAFANFLLENVFD